MKKLENDIPVGILCGGFGTRLSEMTDLIPKPMVEVGGHPIIWHIMKTYAARGFNEFVLALGYRGETIKDYFVSYRYRARSLTVCLADGTVDMHEGDSEGWTVHLLDTGLQTQTGGRIKRLSEFLRDRSLMLTYGDAVCDLDIRDLLEFHRRKGKLATVTAVRPPARFGGMSIDGDSVTRFEEKPQIGEGWINGGFFVLEPGVVDYVRDDETVWEREPMERLAADEQLVAYRHHGFWQCMDTMRDVRLLESLWQRGNAPWKTW